ncbi:hypothetical protein BD309DRAFT_259022 [Dichomitus squalens]|nr:hypothetical protein BD309DRAFT_259022 [Dichomitus squalens]
MQKDEDFWFEDGNIVIIAQDIGFRLHKSILSSSSLQRVAPVSPYRPSVRPPVPSIRDRRRYAAVRYKAAEMGYEEQGTENILNGVDRAGEEGLLAGAVGTHVIVWR